MPFNLILYIHFVHIVYRLYHFEVVAFVVDSIQPQKETINCKFDTNRVISFKCKRLNLSKFKSNEVRIGKYN